MEGWHTGQSLNFLHMHAINTDFESDILSLTSSYKDYSTFSASQSFHTGFACDSFNTIYEFTDSELAFQKPLCRDCPPVAP